MYASMFKLLAGLLLICIVRGNTVRTENKNNSENNELDLESRIFGGYYSKNCDSFEFSFVARLFITSGNGQSLTICSGTVISAREILTAAHCLRPNGVKATQIWAHVHEENHLIGSNDIFVPSNYRGSSNDIGLIKMAYDTFFVEGKYPLLPRGLQSNFQDSEAVIAGWGITSNSMWSPFSDYVLHAHVTITSHATCQTHFHEPNVICTLSEEKICAGDSGGPLLYTTNNKRTYVIGIAAFGSINCNSNTEPSGYTAVQPNVAWITSVRRD